MLLEVLEVALEVLEVLLELLCRDRSLHSPLKGSEGGFDRAPRGLFKSFVQGPVHRGG